MKLHFKRGKQEGLHPQPFYYLTTSATTSSTPTTATPTPTHTQSMCSSPSHSQEPQTSSENQSLQPNPQHQHDSPQALEPINPAIQPDPDKQKSTLDHCKDNEEEPEEEADEEQEDQDQDQENPGVVLSAFPLPPSSIDALVDPQVRMTSPSSHHSSSKRPFSKRKKGKGNVKKKQAIEKKLQTLLENLNPVPFIPSKIPDFSRHEKLLKRLGLWEFFHIEFDRSIRADLIAQLIATYDPKHRCGYVNDFRIAVNRADLARAFKLPVKKEKGGNIDGVDVDFEALTDESIGFIEGFVSNWVLLHEDTWMMPNEVLNWTKAIKEGHPEKVDWAGLFWFMVEKELLKGEQLVDCYYASHLQYLIKSQREKVMLTQPEEVVLKVDQDEGDLNVDEVVVKEEQDRVDLDAEKEVAREEEEKREVELDAEDVVLREEQDGVKLDAEVKEEKGADVKMDDMSEVQENNLSEGPNVELTLGPEVGDKEEGKDVEMMDIEEGEEDEEQELGQRQWLLDGKNNAGEHFMQRCSVEDTGGFDSFEERKEEVDELEGDEEDAEEEGEDGFDVGPGDDTLGGDGLTGNFLQAMETNHIAFGSQGHLPDDSSMDLVDNRNELQHITAAGLSFYNGNGKREIDHEHDILHHSLNGSNKRSRIDGPMDLKSLDFGTCMGQMQQIMARARMLYEEKEQDLEQSNLNQQVLIDELQKRNSMIEHLHKSKCEEIQKRDVEMYGLQRELYLMGNLLDDYRKALKQTNKAFTEYRQKCQLPEEPIYRDAGPGGAVLSSSEIEKQRLKEEEEYKLTCTILEQKAKEAEEGYAFQFGNFLDKVLWLDKRLTEVEKTFKELRELYSKPKVSENQQIIVETSECPPSD